MDLKVNVSIPEYEEYSEGLSQQIVNAVVEKIYAETKGVILNKVNAKVDELMAERLNKVIEDFLDKEVQQTDQWGKPVGDPMKLEEMIHRNFEKNMTGKVDATGKVSTYNSTQTRYEWLVSKAVNAVITARLKNEVGAIVKQAKKKVGAEFENAIKAAAVRELGFDPIKKLLEGNSK